MLATGLSDSSSSERPSMSSLPPVESQLHPHPTVEERLKSLTAIYDGLQKVADDPTLPANGRMTLSLFGAVAVTFAILSICGTAIWIYVLLVVFALICVIYIYHGPRACTRSRASPSKSRPRFQGESPNRVATPADRCRLHH